MTTVALTIASTGKCADTSFYVVNKDQVVDQQHGTHRYQLLESGNATISSTANSNGEQSINLTIVR